VVCERPWLNRCTGTGTCITARTIQIIRVANTCWDNDGESIEAQRVAELLMCYFPLQCFTIDVWRIIIYMTFIIEPKHSWFCRFHYLSWIWFKKTMSILYLAVVNLTMFFLHVVVSYFRRHRIFNFHHLNVLTIYCIQFRATKKIKYMWIYFLLNPLSIIVSVSLFLYASSMLGKKSLHYRWAYLLYFKIAFHFSSKLLC
jgi:hypothetical protein